MGRDLYLDEDALLGLTETERNIMLLVLKEGLSPREVAEKLGVSVKTVYKARHKYRKNLLGKNGGKTRNNFSHGKVPGNAAVEQAIVESVSAVFRELETRLVKVVKNAVGEAGSARIVEIRGVEELAAAIGKLSESINMLALALEKGRYGLAKNIEQDENNLPSFVAGNPWLEVLRERKA